jgi:hypothetical protein
MLQKNRIISECKSADKKTLSFSHLGVCHRRATQLVVAFLFVLLFYFCKGVANRNTGGVELPGAVLTRNIRIEEDLVDHLFNSTEKRLARSLLLLARYGKQEHPRSVLPRISQETLAEMIGTSRTRVNLFMNKFKKLGFIKYNGGLQVNNSLLSVVLHD